MLSYSELSDTEEIVLTQILRILEIVIQTTRDQTGKKLEIDELDKSIYELGRSQKLSPPFNSLLTSQQVISEALLPKDLFDNDMGTEEALQFVITLLRSIGVLYEIGLDGSQYEEPKKIVATPLAFTMYHRLLALYKEGLQETLSSLELSREVEKCHRLHSELALEAFKQKVDDTVRRSNQLSSFNISLSIYLMMYGAIQKQHSLSFVVDPTNNIDRFHETIATEIDRILQYILPGETLGKQTLLDHFQTSGKIERILKEKSWFRKENRRISNGKTQYTIFFDLAPHTYKDPDATARIDSVLRAITLSAKIRQTDADQKLLDLLNEHIRTFNVTVKPIATEKLFQWVPTVDYVRFIRERFKLVLQSLEGSESEINSFQEEEEEQ